MRKRIATGYFSFCLVYGMTVRDLSGKTSANLVFDRVRFLGPVFHGYSLYTESRIKEKRESKSRPMTGIISVETRGLNQHGEVVLTFERSFFAPIKTDRAKGCYREPNTPIRGGLLHLHMVQ